MYKIDYHIHTRFSMDSKADPLEEILAAKSRGIDDLIFTDHCDCNYELATPPDMEPWPFLEVEEYWKYMNELRNTSGYDFGIGLEIGQSTQELERANGVIASHDWDFVIGSLHNLNHEYDFCLLDYRNRDVYKIFGDYFAELYDTAKINNFSVLGHLYYPIRYVINQGIDFDLSRFDADMAEILKVIAQNGKGIEVNLKGFEPSKNNLIPNLKYIKMFRDLGGEIITVGSDGHDNDAVGKYVTEATEIVKEAGFNYVAKFRKMKPTFERI